MNQKIYNIQIQMRSQNDCDAVKKICEDYGLDYWKYEKAFEFNEGDIFTYDNSEVLDKSFFVMKPKGDGWDYSDREPITIEQFLELLNEK